MKVAFRNAEYFANIPPRRFAPGDVIEVEDEWGQQLLRRGIAVAAKPGAKTAMELRVAMRPPTADDGGEADRAARRAALQAELDALDRADAAPRPSDEGHYADMVTRDGATQSPKDDKPAPPKAERK